MMIGTEIRTQMSRCKAMKMLFMWPASLVPEVLGFLHAHCVLLNTNPRSIIHGLYSFGVLCSVNWQLVTNVWGHLQFMLHNNQEK
jgi:hypothetical protein